jgi:prepilin-type N-terminal cleavage/methylation domain-containing protein
MTAKIKGRMIGRLQAGFTLVELMVVVVVIGILATVGGSFFQAHVLEANVGQAIPYLNSIAAKNRIHFNRTGYYLATGSEEEIQKKLGVDLSEAGDFCFMIFCQSAALCANYGATPYSSGTPTLGVHGSFISIPVSTPAVTTLFQVVAVLRQKTAGAATTGTVSGAGSTCTPSYLNAPLKQEPRGWVAAAGAKGGQERVAVLSYPPPVDGLDPSATTIAGHGVQLTWRQGISLTDATSN